MKVTLLYLDDCPHWRELSAHLRTLERELPGLQVAPGRRYRRGAPTGSIPGLSEHRRRGRRPVLHRQLRGGVHCRSAPLDSSPSVAGPLRSEPARSSTTSRSPARRDESCGLQSARGSWCSVSSNSVTSPSTFDTSSRDSTVFCASRPNCDDDDRSAGSSSSVSSICSPGSVEPDRSWPVWPAKPSPREDLLLRQPASSSPPSRSSH